jgi:2-dehydro-3-deoxygalactonokinase
MRGEEVQIFGALALAETAGATVCLPGTHSKWAQVDNGSILRFSTFLTGELFALLQQHSSIAALTEETAATDDTPVDEDAFLQGVAYSRQAGSLLHHMFSPRARVLTGDWASSSLSDYLSGLIIGHEFAGASALYPNTGPLLVVGNARLQALYQLAAGSSGWSLINIDAEQATLAGLRALTESSLPASEECPC